MDTTISNEETILDNDIIEIEDTTEGEETLSAEEAKALKKQVATLQAQKEHFRKKAEKAGEIKPNTPSDNGFTREEAVLIAQGMDLDDLDKLKAIQKGLGLGSFKEALESDLFTAYSDKKKADKKRQQASLGASGGTGRSGTIEAKPNMSEEDHRKLWEKSYRK